MFNDSPRLLAAAAATTARKATAALEALALHTQDRRLILLETPLGPQLIAERLHVVEGINQLFEHRRCAQPHR